MAENLKSIKLKKKTSFLKSLMTFTAVFGIGLLLVEMRDGSISAVIPNFFLFYVLLMVGIFVTGKCVVPSEYHPCPYCDKSVKIKEDWQCDNCNNYQGKQSYIFDTCVHCKRYLDTVYCEHCHKEFRL